MAGQHFSFHLASKGGAEFPKSRKVVSQPLAGNLVMMSHLWVHSPFICSKNGKTHSVIPALHFVCSFSASLISSSYIRVLCQFQLVQVGRSSIVDTREVTLGIPASHVCVKVHPQVLLMFKCVRQIMIMRNNCMDKG